MNGPLDCAAPCLLASDSEKCDFFVFEPNSFCYFGAFDKLDGTMESSALSFHIYVEKGRGRNCTLKSNWKIKWLDLLSRIQKIPAHLISLYPLFCSKWIPLIENFSKWIIWSMFWIEFDS